MAAAIELCHWLAADYEEGVSLSCSLANCLKSVADQFEMTAAHLRVPSFKFELTLGLCPSKTA